MASKIDNPPNFNVWHALGLTPPAAKSKVIGISYKEIRKAYRQASLHCHDDKIHQRAPGAHDAFPSMTQVNIARDFLLKGSQIDELAYRFAVRTFATTSKVPFHPELPIGDKGVFDVGDNADSDFEEISQDQFTPSSKTRSHKFSTQGGETYAESDIDADYQDDGARSDGSSDDSDRGPPPTAKGRRGAGHSRRPRAAPYPDRKGGPAKGAKTSKSQHKAETFPSGLGNLVDIAEAPKLTSIFVGWHQDNYNSAPVNKEHIPIVLAFFTREGRLAMQMVGLTRGNQIIPGITSTTVCPQEVVPNAHFVNMSMPEVQNEVLRLMHIPVGRRTVMLSSLYFGGMAQL